MAIQIRRGTDAEWESNKSNIVAGEPAVAMDTERMFIGTGSGTYMEAANIDVLANAFDPSASYVIGDFASYHGKVYKFTSTHSGAWNASDVEEVVLADELDSLGDDVYTKAEADALLLLKADTATTYTKTEVNTALALKADKSDTYTKTETYTKAQVDSKDSALKDEIDVIDNIVGNPLIVKNSVVLSAKNTMFYMAQNIVLKAGVKYTATFRIAEAKANLVYCYVYDSIGGTIIATAHIAVGTTSNSVSFTPSADILTGAIGAQTTKDAIVGTSVMGEVVRNGEDYVTENTKDIKNVLGVVGDGSFSPVSYQVEAGGFNATIGEALSFSTSTNYNRTHISVTEGEIYRVTTRINANVSYPSLAFTNSSDIAIATALGEAVSEATVMTEVVTVPPNATTMWVRDRNSTSSSAIVIEKMEKTISEYVDELRDEVLLNIPSYYATHIASKVDTINDITNANINTDVTKNATKLNQFVFITDYHYDNSGSDYDNTQHSAELIEYIQKNVGIEFVCHGGDIINNQSTQKDAIKYINAFRDEFDKIDNLYYCIGNHEYNSAESLTWAQIAKLLNGNKLNIASMDGYGDFYFDNDATKTRYIFMGCDRRSTSGDMISSGQISWFLESMKDVPNDYDCLLMIHRILQLTFDTVNQEIDVSVYSDCEDIADGIDAFNGHSTYTYSGTTYDYSSKTGAFICVLTGHSHTDASMTLTSGTPIIMVTTDCQPKRHTSYDWTNSSWLNESTKGTTGEQAFDVVTIDKENRNIYCTRIGYGSDREFTY